MRNGSKVTIRCICCGRKFESGSTNGCYCEDCRGKVKNRYNSYRHYCTVRRIKPHSSKIFRTYFKRYGLEGLRIDNESLLVIIDDIADSTSANINKELRDDVLKATQLGLSYGQYASMVRDIHN